jgi:GntR family transcriptional repressor for pyruvate dehydrogenase complex
MGTVPREIMKHIAKSTRARRDAGRKSFRRVKSNEERLYHEVVKQIETRILAGALKPGDMLPPERVMAEQFGVSRTVIREATKALELQGLVEVQHGRGVMVDTPSLANVADSLLRYMRIRESPIWALWELRRIIEVEIAGLAAERWEDADLAEVKTQLTRLEASVDNPQEYIEHDFEFHRAIARAGHNPLFPTVLEPFVSLLRESRHLGASVPNAPFKSIIVHRRIVDAIEKRNPPEARTAMREHFTQVAEFLAESQAITARRR